MDQLGSSAIAERAVAQQAALRASLGKYKRGERPDVSGLQDKKLKGELAAAESQLERAAVGAAQVEQWLLPAEAGVLEAEGMERTYQFSQEALALAADCSTRRKLFDLALPLGPYTLDYTPNGRHVAIAGRRGHLALFDWTRPRLVTELQVRETTRAVKFLHNTNFFAAAQEKYVYIYDKRGLEVHCMCDHEHTLALEFLQRFFLLASCGEAGIVRWQDTSTGMLVAQHRTRLGACRVLRANPHNGVLLCGHGNGSITMWSPNLGSPLVTMLCHRGAVRCCGVDASGRYLVTGGADAQVKVWDVRTYKPLHAYFSATPPSSVDISQRGMLAVAYGPHVQVWQHALGTKAKAPYLTHLVAGGGTATACARFCPYEDILGVGHTAGMSSLMVPGSGEPNYDTFVANPNETKKQRQEAEVHALLDKLQPAMITLDPDQVGGLMQEPKEVQIAKRKEQAIAEAAARREAATETDAKKKMKGRRKASVRHRRKQLNVIDERRASLLEQERLGALTGGATKSDAARSNKRTTTDETPLALRRFTKKA